MAVFGTGHDGTFYTAIAHAGVQGATAEAEAMGGDFKTGFIGGFVVCRTCYPDLCSHTPKTAYLA